jgi:hypothetical protein
MTRAYELRLELQNHLDIPDSRGTFNAGISSAADWFNELSSNDQFLLVDYLVRENTLSPSLRLGDLENLILLARISINQAFLPLLEMFLNHAKSIELMCTEAMGRLQPYTYEQLCNDLFNAIQLT